MVEFPQIKELEVEVPKGQGAIKTFELLKEKLAEQYAEEEQKPSFVNQILDTDAEELAKKYNFYNPNSPAESALIHQGDSFRLSENGLEYLKADGTTILLEENDLNSQAEGLFGQKGGKMFDSNPNDLGSGSVVAETGGERVKAVEYQDALGEDVSRSFGAGDEVLVDNQNFPVIENSKLYEDHKDEISEAGKNSLEMALKQKNEVSVGGITQYLQSKFDAGLPNKDEIVKKMSEILVNDLAD
jgi:hypothetical protein